MGPREWYLVTVLNEDCMTLVKVAVKLAPDSLAQDQIEFYLEPENRQAWGGILPDHVSSMGPVVDVESLFEGVVL